MHKTKHSLSQHLATAVLSVAIKSAQIPKIPECKWLLWTLAHTKRRKRSPLVSVYRDSTAFFLKAIWRPFWLIQTRATNATTRLEKVQTRAQVLVAKTTELPMFVLYCSHLYRSRCVCMYIYIYACMHMIICGCMC